MKPLAQGFREIHVVQGRRRWGAAGFPGGDRKVIVERFSYGGKPGWRFARLAARTGYGGVDVVWARL
jgi:hypothetical protein